MLFIKIDKKGTIIQYNKKSVKSIVNNSNLNKLHVWEYKGFDVIIYGSKDGNAGNENKYDLPPPLDCELFFDDLYIIKYKDENIIDFDKEDYENFYNDKFGGFVDLDNTEELSEEEELSEHTSDREFIVNDSESVDDEEYSDISSESVLESNISSSMISSGTNNITNSMISLDNKNVDEDNDSLSSITVTMSDIDEDNQQTESESESDTDKNPHKEKEEQSNVSENHNNDDIKIV